MAKPFHSSFYFPNGKTLCNDEMAKPFHSSLNGKTTCKHQMVKPLYMFKMAKTICGKTISRVKYGNWINHLGYN